MTFGETQDGAGGVIALHGQFHCGQRKEAKA
jgi:hypothetical protein